MLSNVGARLYPGTEQEVALQTGVFSRHGCERVIRYAYELAKAEGKSLTSISKGNALGYSMVFWDEIFAEIGKEYPDVPTQKFMVDAASMFFVKDPKRFQIVVTSNLFGDIVIIFLQTPCFMISSTDKSNIFSIWFKQLN